jgi:GTP-binding protein
MLPAGRGTAEQGRDVSRQAVVVIVGRPNVGKSTLFNRLTRSRRALVHDLPGVTRDRIVADAPRPGGGAVTLVDTGGLLLDDQEGYLPFIRAQAETAMRGADAILFVLDGAAGPIPEDREIASFLRALKVPVVPVANRSDRAEVELQAPELFALGLGEPVVISAEHGRGIAELWEALEPHLGEATAEPEPTEVDRDVIQVAIIGRPNVGKSSLLNRLLGQPRTLVSEVPGTTRDAVDVMLERDGQRYLLVDTAGIRRKGKTDRGPEVLSVVMARRYLERAAICLVLVDAVEGITKQDAHVAGYAWEAGRALAIVVNKWDLVSEREKERRRLEDLLDQHLKFARSAPLLFLSALTGQGVQRLFPLLGQLHASFRRRVATGELNRVLRDAWQRQPPPVAGKREAKLFYALQVQHGPPAFVLYTNFGTGVHFSYLRFLENTLRDAFDLAGVPIRVMIRGRKH